MTTNADLQRCIDALVDAHVYAANSLFHASHGVIEQKDSLLRIDVNKLVTAALLLYAKNDQP